jgi:peptidoglycan/xylan/chitin deacetylase (PgdA/CDA1 family)
MLKRAARKAARTISVLVPGGLSFARRVRRRSVAIVMYHGVVEEELPVWNWCQLHRNTFDKQIAFLANEYRILPLRDVIERLSRGLSAPEGTVCITFDDGFRSVLSTAYPILLKYQAPATVFLVTSLIGGSEPPWPEQLYCALASSTCDTVQFEGANFSLQSNHDRASAFERIGARLLSLPAEEEEAELERLLQTLGQFSYEDYDALAMLDWKEVKKLDAGGLLSFGSHTHTHKILSRCSPERQRFELLTSRQLMLDHIGKADLFAYPNGSATDFTSETKRLLLDLGYGSALTTIRA